MSRQKSVIIDVVRQYVLIPNTLLKNYVQARKESKKNKKTQIRNNMLDVWWDEIMAENASRRFKQIG